MKYTFQPLIVACCGSLVFAIGSIAAFNYSIDFIYGLLAGIGISIIAIPLFFFMRILLRKNETKEDDEPYEVYIQDGSVVIF